MSVAPDPATYLAGGLVAGLVAAVAMDLPMSRQPDGWTPACIATAVVRRTSPDAIRFRDVAVVHHGTGAVAGGLYGAIAFGLGAVAPWPGTAGSRLLGHLLAVMLVTLFVYLAFAHAVLPRAGESVYEERATAVRGQWLRSTLTFAATMTVAGPLMTALLRAGLGV